MSSILSGSEVFLLIMTGIGFVGACLGLVLNFVLKSRCTEIKCCGGYCIRDVLPADRSDLDTTAIESITVNR